MVSYGSSRPEPPGGISPSDAVLGALCTAGFSDGSGKAYGTAILCSYCQGRRKGISELRDTSDRQHSHPGAPACSRAKKGDPLKEALGYSQGGFSTKGHLRTDGDGKLITLILTPGTGMKPLRFMS